MAAYYNEIDPYAAGWLRNLIAAELIPAGDVDERSIVDVNADDLIGYAQCHFFAGLGGWAYSLRRAGWPDDRPVWTGSCPCQGFSVAGKRLGFDDPRHLWPHWQPLIAKRRPTVIFGEQVAAATDWLYLVRSDLETLGYAVGAIPMEAASANADHFRDRYWFVADLSSQRGHGSAGMQGTDRRSVPEADGCGALPNGDDPQRGPAQPRGHDLGWQTPERQQSDGDAGQRGGGALVDDQSLGWGEGWTEHEFRRRGFTASVANCDGSQYVECTDGKWRRLPPPGVRWLGNGIPARVPKLRAIGNAIDPRPAAQFIRAYAGSVA